MMFQLSGTLRGDSGVLFKSSQTRRVLAMSLEDRMLVVDGPALDDAERGSVAIGWSVVVAEEQE